MAHSQMQRMSAAVQTFVDTFLCGALFFPVIMGPVSFSVGNDFYACAIMLCLMELVTIAFFIIPQFCSFHISKFFLPGFLCLWVSYLLFFLNIHFVFDESFTILWPWYFVSIPLYLVPVAFAIGIASLHCVASRPHQIP